MTVEQTNVVDAIGVERESGKVILTISDHLDWSEEDQHLSVLREKINTYVRFIEAGELKEVFPDSIGRKPVIEVFTKYELSPDASRFLLNATKNLEQRGIELRSRVLPD